MSQHTVTINVANKRLKIACPAGHESALLQAAEEINKRLEKDTKKSATMKSPEQALVMMSLNLANDLIQARADLEQEREKMQSKIELLQTREDYSFHSTKFSRSSSKCYNNRWGVSHDNCFFTESQFILRPTS